MPHARHQTRHAVETTTAVRSSASAGSDAGARWSDDQLIDIWQQVRRALVAVDGRLACALSTADAPGALVHEALAAIASSPTGTLSVTYLADVLGLSASGCGRLVDRLVTAGLARRHHTGTDRRVVFTALTDDGAAHERHSTAAHAEQLRIELSVLGPARLSQLTEIASVLRGWTAHVDEVTPSNGPSGPEPIGVTMMGLPARSSPWTTHGRRASAHGDGTATIR